MKLIDTLSVSVVEFSFNAFSTPLLEATEPFRHFYIAAKKGHLDELGGALAYCSRFIYKVSSSDVNVDIASLVTRLVRPLCLRP